MVGTNIRVPVRENLEEQFRKSNLIANSTGAVQMALCGTLIERASNCLLPFACEVVAKGKKSSHFYVKQWD